MIASFADPGTEDVFDGRDSKAARRCCPRQLWTIARRKLDQINRVTQLGDLAIPPGNRLEALRGTRRGQHSIRINQQFRICFTWEEDRAFEVEIVDYH
ncbi:MAG: plasmid maintenance system killer protein [Acidobacteria bacterium]|nr:MAG: plasmid maintenance system killer protein [Acidobacteriota bacterium]REK09811.1 MAG: plasmid maintenance system killer protein [Acidobacteriota bacterium]